MGIIDRFQEFYPFRGKTEMLVYVKKEWLQLQFIICASLPIRFVTNYHYTTLTYVSFNMTLFY